MERRKIRKWIAVLVVAASVMGLAACGQQSASTEANTIYGTVTAIDGSKITLAVGTLNTSMPQGTPPAGGQGPQGTPPAGQAPQGTPPADGQAPQGSPSADGGQGRKGGMLTLTGEEKTITVTDESVITVQDTSSSKTGLAAISAGSTLKIVYDSANSDKITSIVVMGGGMPQGDGTNGTSSTASPAVTNTPTEASSTGSTAVSATP
ncbi:MAG: proline-rich domain-containing protein [Bacillota bacterium]